LKRKIARSFQLATIIKPDTTGRTSPFTRDRYQHFIGSEWVEGASGERIEQRNPATGEIIATVAAGNAADVDRGVRAAHGALSKWSASSAEERQDLLMEFARRTRARAADHARMESLNNGKTNVEATIHDIPHAQASDDGEGDD
jgi:aldehyde dehydrogenase